MARAKTAKARSTQPPPYHHGDLKAALLQAAERILVRDGIQGLTLRAAAREAGVSHAAPKNHFDDLTGLLSELAAVGFERFNAAMQAGVAQAPEAARMAALGAGYVRFARDNPGLFLLMFRSERLDFSRPALSQAADAALARLAGASMASSGEARAPETKSVAVAPSDPAAAPPLSVAQAAGIVGAWSFAHGLAMLLIDGRLKPIIDRLPPGTGEADLLAAIGRGSP